MDSPVQELPRISTHVIPSQLMSSVSGFRVMFPLSCTSTCLGCEELMDFLEHMSAMITVGHWACINNCDVCTSFTIVGVHLCPDDNVHWFVKVLLADCSVKFLTSSH